jgi:hypothetical protein
MTDTDFGFRPDDAITDRIEQKNQRQSDARDEAKRCEELAEEKAEKAKQRLESGKGNPVDIVLYYRQQAILENQRAIMEEFGIDQS